MPNPVPSVYFPGISLSGNNEIVFTTANVSPGPATFPELTNAEADPTSGDIRDIIYAILMRISERHGVANPKPQQSSATSSTTASEFPRYQRSVTLFFNLVPSGTEELLDEP